MSQPSCPLRGVGSAIESPDDAHLTTHTFRRRGSSGGRGATRPRLLHPLRRHLRPLMIAAMLAPQAVAGYNIRVKLDRQTITKSALHDHTDDNYVPGTIEEREIGRANV